MIQTDVPLLVAKLVAGGLTAFFAILLMSKTRESAWMCFAAGIITSYAGIVYEMLTMLGIVVPSIFLIHGIPIANFVFAILPSCFFIATAIILIIKN